MTFRRRRRVFRVAALGFAIAAIGAPASLSYNPHVDEGYETSVNALDPAISGVITKESLQGVREARQPSSIGSSSDGFSWIDAGIGAASAFGAIMLAAAVGLPLRRLRRGQLAGA